MQNSLRFQKLLARLSPWQGYNDFFISLVYFVQGSGGITAIAGSLLLREQFGLDFTQQGLIAAAAVIPWSIKPLYGILSDTLPIGGYRRRPYLHIGPLLAVLGFALIGFWSHDFASFLLPLVLANLGLGLTDVATDGLIVEQTTRENAARLQGLTQASIRVAALLSAFLSGLLVHRELLTPQGVYLLQATLPLLTLAASFFVREQRVSGATRHAAADELTVGFVGSMLLIFLLIIGNLVWGGQLVVQLGLPAWSSTLLSAAVWGAFLIWIGVYFYRLAHLGLTTRLIFLAAGFILLWRFNPGAGTPMFFYLKDTLGVSPEVMGFVDAAGQVGSILAVVLAVKFFDRFSLRVLLGSTVIAAGLWGLTSLCVTRPELAEAVGSSGIVHFAALMLALPVHLLDALFTAVTDGQLPSVAATWQSLGAQDPLVSFLYLQTFLGEVLFMLAYIPLLKLAVLVTPRKAEATNYAVIASIMNIGLALSAWASGWLYDAFAPSSDPTAAIDVSTLEILIGINVLTSFACLVLLPWLRTERLISVK